jgi:predicted Zn-dependent protease
LKNISLAEAQKVRATRIYVKPVGAKDSVQSFVEFMNINDFKEETFRVLNGLKPSENLRRGKLVKVISE